MQHLFLLLLHLFASSPSLLLVTDTPLLAACQPNNNCHSRGAGIYAMSVILRGRHAHPCFSPAVSFLESRTGWPRAVSLYRELLSPWHSHTIHTPRWKRVPVRHSATTSACLGFNERRLSASVTPRSRLPPDWNFHRLPLWLTPRCCVGRRLSLVEAACDARNRHKKEMSRHTHTHINKMNWLVPVGTSFHSETETCILLRLRFFFPPLAGVQRPQKPKPFYCLCNPPLCI